MKNFQRFGKGVFKCRTCGRSTRETNRDHGQTGLCDSCFELAGIENAISDADDKATVVAEYADEIRQHLQRIEAKGGKLDQWFDLRHELEVFDALKPLLPKRGDRS